MNTEDFKELETHPEEEVKRLYAAYNEERRKNERYESDPTAIFNAALVGAALEIAERLETKKIDLDDPYTKAAIVLLEKGGKITGSVETGKTAYLEGKQKGDKRTQRRMENSTNVPIPNRK